MDQERSYIHIRPVIQEDLEVLSQLSRQTFIEAFAEANEPEPFQAYLDQAFSEETLQVELGDPSSQFFFALEGKTPIGYLKLVRDKQPSGIPLGKALEIQRIYVRESHLGRRVGKRLMEKALEEAQRLEVNTVWLGVWEHNPKAIGFYEKWGFEVFSSQSFQMGSEIQNDLLMRKELVNFST